MVKDRSLFVVLCLVMRNVIIWKMIFLLLSFLFVIGLILFSIWFSRFIVFLLLCGFFCLFLIIFVVSECMSLIFVLNF